MAKFIALGNNNMLIALDRYGQVYDFYYPYVGLENHTRGAFVHKIGVWVDGQFSWLDDGTWDIHIDLEPETMVTDITARHDGLQLSLHFRDAIYNEKNIFIRRIELRNESNQQKIVKLYCNQQFEIAESAGTDTAIYDHENNVIIHYEGDRVFLINARIGDEGFDDYSIGLLGIEGREGTYKDAEDGELSKNNVEHGRVDSVIGVHLALGAEESKTVDYWLVASTTIPKAHDIDRYIINRGTTSILQSTASYWHAWVNKEPLDFLDLPDRYIQQYKKSLLYVDTHCGHNGTIIASGDSHLLKHGRGTYSYMWPRDGALTVLALNKAGYHNTTRRFFEFCKKVITDEGYMLHKYRSDTTLGDSWHPWVRDCKSELPIQEDETALVTIALWDYYQKTRDLEFIEEVYDSLIRRPAKFMLQHVDEDTGLPKPTYDLWEEKFGVNTFTTATVYGALQAASNFADILGKYDDAAAYRTHAEKVKKGILHYLYDPEQQCFIKLINYSKIQGFINDPTIDMSSVYGVYAFGVLPVGHELLDASIRTIEQRIQCKTSIGGICRYENDQYFRVSQDTPGNPWIITSLWLARYYLHKAQSIEELAPVYHWLDWVLAHAPSSGVLSEQINPLTGEQLSATPLTWSHAEYIQTIIELLEKKKTL